MGSFPWDDVLQHGQVCAGDTGASLECCPRKKSLLWVPLLKLSAPLWNHPSPFPAFRPWDAFAPRFLQAVQADSTCHNSQESKLHRKHSPRVPGHGTASPEVECCSSFRAAVRIFQCSCWIRLLVLLPQQLCFPSSILSPNHHGNIHLEKALAVGFSHSNLARLCPGEFSSWGFFSIWVCSSVVKHRTSTFHPQGPAGDPG